MNIKQLGNLADEVREKIISTVSENGGHLGSNLGMVETTLVLHKLFDLPKDKILFDVSHQCYTHKLLTDRFCAFDTLRKTDGISGYTNRFESKFDTVTAGHSGAALSAAIGIATAEKLKNSDAYTVAVIGDGSFSNGMVYEALNNCDPELKLMIILNDNEMSISSSVGSLARHLSKIRTSGRYYRFKRNFQKVFSKIPLIGNKTIALFRHIKNGFKRMFYKQPFFEPLGIKYFGPVDGNDLERLSVVLKEAKRSNACVLVHIKTKKGKGYKNAEENPEKYHSIGPFDVVTGEKKTECKKEGFSEAFGKIMCEIAQKDEKICAITAAMKDGTGLSEFAEKYKDRFFDVGIAEEHEITFASGLSLAGMTPVCAVYSTFAQRTYDQLIHDVSLQKLHIVLALDRAGFVPDEGETHQGIFDVAMLSNIPNVNIMSPENFRELKDCLEKAVYGEKLEVVRYPKGAPEVYERTEFEKNGDFDVFDEGSGKTVVFVTYGRITANVYHAAKELANENMHARIIKLVKVYPVDFDKIKPYFEDADFVCFVEEGIKSGGISEKILSYMQISGINVKTGIIAVDETFPKHMSVPEFYEKYGFTPEKIRDFVKKSI